MSREYVYFLSHAPTGSLCSLSSFSHNGGFNTKISLIKRREAALQASTEPSVPFLHTSAIRQLGDDMPSSPDEKSFNILITPTSRGRKRRSPGSIPPRTVWKPQPHRLVAVSYRASVQRGLPLWSASKTCRTRVG